MSLLISTDFASAAMAGRYEGHVKDKPVLKCGVEFELLANARDRNQKILVTFFHGDFETHYTNSFEEYNSVYNTDALILRSWMPVKDDPNHIGWSMLARNKDGERQVELTRDEKNDSKSKDGIYYSIKDGIITSMRKVSLAKDKPDFFNLKKKLLKDDQWKIISDEECVEMRQTRWEDQFHEDAPLPPVESGFAKFARIVDSFHSGKPDVKANCDPNRNGK